MFKNKELQELAQTVINRASNNFTPPMNKALDARLLRQAVSKIKPLKVKKW